MNAPPKNVVALIAPVVGRLRVDPLGGEVQQDDRGARLSLADEAALEVACTLAENWGTSVCALSAGGEHALRALELAAGVGVERLVHVDVDERSSATHIAHSLASWIAQLQPCVQLQPGVQLQNCVIVAGAHGADFGSGAVPAFVAHHLNASQALGLVALSATATDELLAVRRVDHGARERLSLSLPAVVSVEGGVARLRRPAFANALAQRTRAIERVVPAASGGHAAMGTARAPRPRPHVVAPPEGGDALHRIRALTGVDQVQSVARSVSLAPDEAADAILDRLGEWGYGPRVATETL